MAAKKKSNEGEPLNYTELAKLGLGRMRLSPSVFYAMLFTEFMLALSGFLQHEQEREQQAWDRARWLGAIVLQPYSKRGKGIKPTDLAKFPWDKPPKKNKKKSKAENLALSLMLKRADNGKTS